MMYFFGYTARIIVEVEQLLLENKPDFFPFYKEKSHLISENEQCLTF